MKYFVFAIDDGTVFDKKVIEIFNKYNIRATFNLNSGLQDFIWYKGDLKVSRLNLEENKHIYDGHEVASHSLTHPFLTSMDDDGVYREAKEDVDNLSNIFSRNITTFSFPFDGFDERTINIIKSVGITHIILPEIDDSFNNPSDMCHIKVTSWDIDDALIKINKFIEDDDAKLFIYLSHSYDYEYSHSYDKLERLCQIIKSNENIKTVTIGELI